MSVTRILDEMTETELTYWRARESITVMSEEAGWLQSRLLRLLLFAATPWEKGKRRQAFKGLFPDIE